MTTRSPPRFVPTLTEVVRTPPVGAPQGASAEPVFLEEQIVARVMQRVDMALERKLREAIASVVLEHTRSLGPMLREQIESVVRQTVTQALADEIAAQQKQGAKPSP